MTNLAGTLFLVGTPIGNLEDVSMRAVRVLKEVDLIAAEDTRHSGKLLAHFEIRKPLVSYHEFNEAKRTAELVQRLEHGASVAVITDAGMPSISDPGQRLVSAAVARGIPVQVVPGPSAVTMAVALAGFSSGRFLFHGFLPHKAGQRCRVLQSLAPLPYSLVFFESPFRTLASLQDMRDALGDRRAMVARELTKKFEEVLRGKLSELITQLGNRTIKGEVTVVVEGADQ